MEKPWILSILCYLSVSPLTLNYSRDLVSTYWRIDLAQQLLRLKKIRLLTDVETARFIYLSYFHSIMSYGILLWGIKSILVLQKRAILANDNGAPKDSLRQKF